VIKKKDYRYTTIFKFITRIDSYRYRLSGIFAKPAHQNSVFMEYLISYVWYIRFHNVSALRYGLFRGVNLGVSFLLPFIVLYSARISLPPPHLPPSSWFFREQCVFVSIHGLRFIYCIRFFYPISFSIRLSRFYKMGRKKDSETIFRRARKKDCGRDTGIVNIDSVLKKIEPQIERNYQKKLDLWDQYVILFK
jgi:hypothetical protein